MGKKMWFKNLTSEDKRIYNSLANKDKEERKLFRKKCIAEQRKLKKAQCGCVYVPHPENLMHTFCIKCGRRQPTFFLDVKKYNKKRRQYKAALRLSSVIAPISPDSKNVIQGICELYGLESNTSVVHVTLAEGVRPPRSNSESNQKARMVENLRRGLLEQESAPILRGNNLQCIPTRRDADQSLIILQLQLTSEAVKEAVESLERTCLLPQYPLHCALGVTDTSRAKEMCQEQSDLSKQIQGMAISLNMEYMQDLDSPPLEQSPDQTKMLEAFEEARQKQTHCIQPMNKSIIEAFERAQTIRREEQEPWAQWKIPNSTRRT